MHSTSKRGRRLRTARLFAVCIFWLLLMITAFRAMALNTDYLQEEKWRSNQKVTWKPIDASADGRSITGRFGWYVDNDRCLYTYFAIAGDLPENGYDAAKIVYHVRAGNEEYGFAADKDGICDALSDEVSHVFDVRSNFEGCHHGVYISAAQYLGSEETCRFDISFYDAARAVPVKEDIAADLPAETTAEETTRYTVEKEKTTKAATTRESTTKRTDSLSNRAGGSASNKTGTSAKTTATTKFVPQGNRFAEEGAVTADTAQTAAESTAQAAEIDTVVSTEALVLLAIGAFVLLCGGGLLTAFCLRCRRHARRSSEADGMPPSEQTVPEDQPELPPPKER